MMKISFEIPGKVQPKGRPRMGRYGAYTPETTKKYEKFVAGYAKLAMAGKKLLES